MMNNVAKSAAVLAVAVMLHACGGGSGGGDDSSDDPTAPSPSPTIAPTPSPSPTMTPVPTQSPSPTMSPTPSPEPTATPSPEPTATPTPEPTATPEPPSLESVRGLNALAPRNQSFPTNLLEHPDIRAIVVRSDWLTLELKKGLYDQNLLSQIETDIQRADDANKNVVLMINSGGVNTPDWVMDLGVDTFSFVDGNAFHDTAGEVLTIPVFWDPVFLEHKIDFIRFIGQQYSQYDNISVVHLQCYNATTVDWNVPRTDDDINSWLAAGYTSTKMVDACKQLMDATMEAFPSQFVRTAVGRNSTRLDPDSDYIARETLNYANENYPGRLLIERMNLSAVMPDPETDSNLGGWNIIFDNQPYVGAQTLWLASDESSCRMMGGASPCDAEFMFSRAIEIGQNYGLQYFDLYGADLSNPQLQDEIREAAEMFDAQ